MIQQTVARSLCAIPAERIRVITNADLVEQTKVQLPDLPGENIIGEPCGRDTAPCVGFAAALARQDDPDAVTAVMPADHLIQPLEEFARAVEFAASLAAESEALITFGIRPVSPSVNFGYIHRGEKDSGADGFDVYRVREFKEKPDLATAEEFVASGEYYWNSGIFVWRCDVILSLIEEHMPDLHEGLARIEAALDTPVAAEVIAREYPKFTKISIDYGVMEKAPDVRVIEATFDWDDVGSWQTTERLHEADDCGNVVLGSHCGLDTRGCIVAGQEGHLVATVGTENLVIVHTDDATLICSKDRAPDVKALVDALREKGLEQYL